MKFIKQYKEALSMELREHRSSFLVYMVLRLLVILVLILQIFNQNWENVFYALLTLLLLIVPSVVQMTFKIELPITLEIIILLFIFAAEILGEIDGFYLKYSNWDTMLHTMNGFLAAAIGYSLVDILNKSNDGFKIASEDLKLRGPGDFFGIRQSGEMQFFLADIYQDASVLQQASEEVQDLLATDPELCEEENINLQHYLEIFFEDQKSRLNL